MIRKVMLPGAFCALLLARPAHAQNVHLSVGLMNVGQLSREQTHHARLGGNGHDVYFAASIEGKISGPLRLMARATYMPTYFYVWPCAQTPCEHINRWSYRPAVEGSIGSSVSFSTASIGLNIAPSRWLEINGGTGLALIHAADERLWGGVPMAVPMFSAEARAKAPLDRIFPTLPNFGIGAGVDWIPAGKRSRVIVIDEFAGAKQSGQPLQYKQRNWTAVHLGFDVAI